MQKKRIVITEDPNELLHKYGEDILSSERFQSMKNYNHHRNSNTYAHSVAVALRALEIAKKKKRKVDPEVLVRACLLHDYYLYNHRTSERIKWHLLRHPRIAAENAVRDFDVSPEVVKIIRSHMWPINPWRVPLGNEAWTLMQADKSISFRERYPKKPKKK